MIVRLVATEDSWKSNNGDTLLYSTLLYSTLLYSTLLAETLRVSNNSLFSDDSGMIRLF